jgi:conjugal transfer pilus assembly protein TraD
MSPSPSAPRRPPYWLAPVFVALMLAPPTWAVVALIAGSTAVTLLRGAIGLRERRKAAAEATDDAVVLGSGLGGERLLLTDRQLSAHGLILGASGAGKSTTLLTILTDRIRRGLPVVAIDLKGSPAFAGELAAAAEAAGRSFRAWTPDGPSHWNPLQHGNATELKDKLIGAERFTEPHYQRAAERYVQTVFQVLEHAHPERAPTLDQVVRLMDPRLMSSMLRHVPRQLGERVQNYLAGLTPDQLSAIRGLGTRLAIISESHAGQYLSAGAGEERRAIDLRRALAGDEVVLFSLNSSTYGKLSAQLGTLVVQDLIAASGHRLGRRDLGADADAALPAMVGIDEFSALGADHVVSLLARSRGAGVSVILATQELADLDRAAPGLRDQVLGNTAVKIAHRQDVPASAQTIAQMAGTQKVWEHTFATGNPLVTGFHAGRGSRRQVEQFVIHPNEIKGLRTGQAVVLAKLPSATARTVRVSAPRRPARGPELV